jgi:hypothetical protein
VASAPAAIELLNAICPECRPITSIKNNRLCEEAVSRILSIADAAVFTAVSYPIVKSVPLRSLSIVPGIPTPVIADNTILSIPKTDLLKLGTFMFV